MSGQSKFFMGLAVVAGAAAIAAGAVGLLAYAGVAGAVSIVGSLGYTHLEGYIGDQTFDLGKPGDIDVDGLDGEYVGIREVVDDEVLPVSAALTGGGVLIAGGAIASSRGEPSGYSGRNTYEVSHTQKVDMQRGHKIAQGI